MAVDIWDEDGRPVTGEQGELVCTRAFPSMPVGFWNDQMAAATVRPILNIFRGSGGMVTG